MAVCWVKPILPSQPPPPTQGLMLLFYVTSVPPHHNYCSLYSSPLNNTHIQDYTSKAHIYEQETNIAAIILSKRL